MYLDYKESPVGIFGILLEKASQKLKITSAEIRSVEFACRRGVSNELCMWRRYSLLFKTLLTPGGIASMPALIASKACSSEGGSGVHLRTRSVSAT